VVAQQWSSAYARRAAVAATDAAPDGTDALYALDSIEELL
jgi:hypothetical protein